MMKPERIITVVLAIMIVSLGIYIFFTRTSINKLRKEVSATADALKQVDTTVVRVIRSLQESKSGIDTLLEHIDESQQIILRLSGNSRALIDAERRNLSVSAEKLQHISRQLDSGQRHATELIETLNRTRQSE